MIIELDGSQHLDQVEYDIERSKYFESQGYKVVPQGDDIRFWNNDVEREMDGVIRVIQDAVSVESYGD